MRPFEGEPGVAYRLVNDFPYWAEQVGKIVDIHRKVVPFKLKEGQLRLDEALMAQRLAGQPQRAVVLKSRKLGFSSYTQGKLIHAATQRPRRDATVIAHDKSTSQKIYEMGERMWRSLPADMRPELGEYRRRQHLHFAGEGNWRKENTFPDSRYTVDTANEFQAGRGWTPTEVHASEAAFWERIDEKLQAVKNSVPRLPDTLVILESTPNGFNTFKDIWDDAEAGRSGYIPFFWPWWREPEYGIRFINEAEREAFVVGDSGHPYAEEEPWILEVGREHDVEITLEQLNWRRQTIADECNGKIASFHEEYGTTPEQCFIASGEKAFDPQKVAQILVRTALTDPRIPTVENPGPTIGDFEVAESEVQVNRVGDPIEVPTKALWVPRERGLQASEAPYRLWLPEEEQKQPAGQYVVAVDVSGGATEQTEEPDRHAIEVFDHKERVQVCEYVSRCDPDLLAKEVLKVALFFNYGWVAVERTGSWGLPILRVLFYDYHYPFVYRAKQIAVTSEKTERKLGWDTNTRTKPELIAGMQALIRTGEDGIRSRAAAEEVQTYARDSKGGYGAEPGKFDDRVMAIMIAQQVARETPPREDDEDINEMVGDGSFEAARENLSSYDSRLG